MTIKQLYEMAKEKGYENAIVGILYSDELLIDCPTCGEELTEVIEYAEKVRQNDIEFGGYFTPIGERLNDCIWINNHPI